MVNDAYILPILNYGLMIWGCTKTDRLAKLLTRAAHLVLNKPLQTSSVEMFYDLGSLSV